jgi:hypothetical protein
MSWLYSRALVEEYSAANSSDGAPSAPSNTTPTPQAFLWRDKTTDAWTRFPSGMTCELLTADRGEGLLKSFLAGFHAKTLVPQVKAPALAESEADCGPKWPESLARWHRDTSSWRTRQCLLFEDSTESLETLPIWGLMQGGELWALTTPEHLIDATESGFWPTPVASDYNARRPSANWAGTDLVSMVWRRSGGTENPSKRPAKLHPDWTEWLMGWPIAWTECTPLATDKFQQWLRSHGVSLADQQHKEAA